MKPVFFLAFSFLFSSCSSEKGASHPSEETTIPQPSQKEQGSGSHSSQNKSSPQQGVEDLSNFSNWDGSNSLDEQDQTSLYNFSIHLSLSDFFSVTSGCLFPEAQKELGPDYQAFCQVCYEPSLWEKREKWLSELEEQIEKSPQPELDEFFHTVLIERKDQDPKIWKKRLTDPQHAKWIEPVFADLKACQLDPEKKESFSKKWIEIYDRSENEAN